MNFLLSIILITIAGLLIPNSLPWWTPLIICFLLGCFIKAKSVTSFFYGFSGMTALWGLGIILAYYNGASIITQKIAMVLKAPSSAALISITLTIGGMLGGLAFLSGNSLKKVTMTKQN